MSMGLLVPVRILGPVGMQFCLSITPIKSTDWTSDLLNSTTMQGLGPLFKKNMEGEAIFFCGA